MLESGGITAVGHYIKDDWTNDQLVQFAKAFLAKFGKIKKSERQALDQLSKSKKQDYLSTSERNFLKTSDLSTQKYGDIDFVTRGVEQQLGRKIAMPRLLLTYPPTQRHFDEYSKSPGTPADRARLVAAVSNTLGTEGYSNSIVREIFNNVPFVSGVVNDYFDERTRATSDLRFTDYVAEEQARVNQGKQMLQRPDVMTYDPTSGQQDIHVNQLMPQYTSSYVTSRFDIDQRENMSKHIMFQRMGNLTYSLRLYKQMSDTIVQDIRILTTALNRASKMHLISTGPIQEAHVLIQNVMRKLSLAYPNYVTIETTPNDALNTLKTLNANVNAAYNATIDSIYSGELTHPEESIGSLNNRYLPRFDSGNYRKVMENSLNSDQLNTQQKDYVRQYLHRNKDFTMQTHLEFMKNIGKMRDGQQDTQFLNRMFDLNTTMGIVSDEMGDEKMHEILQSALQTQVAVSVQNNDLGSAVQYMNALSNPTLQERDLLDFAERYSTNYQYYDSSNPLIRDIWYKTSFLQNTDQQIFDEFTNLKNMVSGFIAQKQIQGYWPNPSEMQTFREAQTALQTKLQEELRRNPNNVVYNSMLNSSVMQYDSSIMYQLFSEPQSPYLASVFNEQFNTMPSKLSQASTTPPSSIGIEGNQNEMQYDTTPQTALAQVGGPKLSPQLQAKWDSLISDKDLTEAKQGVKQGGVIHHYMKHAFKAVQTANLMKDAYDPDLYKQLTYQGIAKRAFKGNALRWMLNVGKDVPDFLKTGNVPLMEFYDQNGHHETMSQDTQVFETQIPPMDKLSLPDFEKMNFIEYDKITDQDDKVHAGNLHHIGGLMTHAQKTYRHTTPAQNMINHLYKISPLPRQNVQHKQVQGCGICSTHDGLHGYSSDEDDITCSECLGKHGITSKRKPAHVKKHVMIGASLKNKHKQLHNDIENNKLFEKIRTQPTSNNWDDFVGSFKGKSLEKTMGLWKSKHVMDRSFVKSDMSKLIFAIGKFLYDEDDVNETFLDNLNMAVIKYLEQVDADDSLKKAKLPSKFHTFDELKELIQSSPGVLKTLLFELD